MSRRLCGARSSSLSGTNILFSGCMDMKSAVLDKPIERIREACDLVGYDFEQRLPDLETYLEGLVADGEDDDCRRPDVSQQVGKAPNLGYLFDPPLPLDWRIDSGLRAVKDGAVRFCAPHMLDDRRNAIATDPLLTAPPSPCSVGTSQPCRLS